MWMISANIQYGIIMHAVYLNKATTLSLYTVGSYFTIQQYLDCYMVSWGLFSLSNEG